VANIRFFWKNLAIDSGVTIVSSSDASPQYAAAAALANPYDRTYIWRSATSTGNQNVEFQGLGGITLTGMFAVNYKVHGSGGTLTAQYSTGGAYVNFGTFTLPSPYPRTAIVAVTGSQASVTKANFLFTNVGAANDYVELGVGVIADSLHDFTPVGRLINARKFSAEDPSPQQYSVGGQRRVYVRPQYLQLEANFAALRSADVNTLVDSIYAANGTATPMVVQLSTAVQDELLYCVMPSAMDFGGLNGGQKSVSFELEELR
jgi:hypothetical protein